MGIGSKRPQAHVPPCPSTRRGGRSSQITVRRRVSMNRIWLLSQSLCALGMLTLAASAQTLPESSTSRGSGPWLVPTAAGTHHWWTRYGEPVNAAQLAAQPSSGSAHLGAPAVSLYGPGYVYGPGSCDCPPPCIWDLWTGYVQNPKRCHPGCGWLHGRCGHCGADAAACCQAEGSTCCRTFCLGQRIREVLSHCHACDAACGRGPACGCTVPASPPVPATSAALVP